MQIPAYFLNSEVCTQMWAILIHPGKLYCHRNCDDQNWNRKRNSLLRMYLTARKNILNILSSQKHCSFNISRHFPLTLGVSIVLIQLSASLLAVEGAFGDVSISLCLSSAVLFTLSDKDGTRGSSQTHQTQSVPCSLWGYPLPETPLQREDDHLFPSLLVSLPSSGTEILYMFG